MAIFKGAGVAIVTPMKADGEVNYDVLGEMLEAQIQGGTDAIIICGTTGESATLTEEEHSAVIRYAIKKVNKRIPVIAGTGSNCTATAIKLSKEAEKDGADGLLLVTPYYNKTTQAGLVEHFTKIAESTSLPVILYNVPGRTGMNIAPETYEKLSKIPNINGVKECNLTQVPTTQRLCGDELNIYSGEDGLVTMALSAGALGVVSVVADLMPGYMSDMVHKYLDGKHEEAYNMQLDILDLVDALFCEVNPIPIKEAYNILGLDEGIVRLPLVHMAPANREKLEKVLAAHGLTKGSISL